ncbi:MAG: cation-translocating P-type ATPase [Thermoguttaceae bacterium]|nr:cation-translocating P-type ATPase [Thermoguttaceae bacterium]
MLHELAEFCESLKMTVVSGCLLLVSLVMMAYGVKTVYDPALLTTLISGFPLAYEAFETLFEKRRLSSELLVTIAMAACVALGEFFAAGEVAFIMILGETLEEMTINRARKGLQKLVALAPVQGRRVVNGQEETIPAEEIQIGDVLRVLPGETIPVDSVILSGDTTVDQSAMTGESLPVEKAVGDALVSGVINLNGAIEIRAEKVVRDSALHKLINLVEQAEKSKAPTQKIVDVWAQWLVPIAVLLAIATFLVTGLATGEWTDALRRGITILVVFCPCALALATPTAIMAAIGQATRHGILIKNGEALEKMGKVNAVAFDKTGTLTYGALRVSDVVTLDGRLTREDVLTLAASAEQRSEHPLGKAIVKQAKEENLALYDPEYFAMQSGKGIQANIRGRSVLCGSEKWITEKGVVLLQSDRDALQVLRSTGSAVILTAADGKLVGLIALSDTPREGVHSMVEQLESLNVDTVLLTGDNRQTAEYFVRQNGLTRFEAELLPGEKAKAIETLQAEGRRVCMIGDGVNDAPALKTADIGVAMGEVGSDVAVEAADIVLMTEDLGRIGYLKKLSNAVIQSITVNISLAMGINFVAIILSMLGIMGPISGALVHNAGSVLVILNAALLYDRKFD